jgi:di/tricarboxylate transporter
MIDIIVFLAIIISIAYGFKTKRNAGIFAMVCAYIIGCFLLNMKPSEVISCWPSKIFLYVLSVSLFFNFAAQNGTLEKLSLTILYAFRKSPKSLLFVLFFVNLFMAAMGVGNMPVVAMFAPIMIMICYKTGIDFLFGAIAINAGSIAGANFMTSVNGLVFRSLMDEVGFTEESFSNSAMIFVISIILPLIILTVYTLVSGRKKAGVTEIELEKPEPFTAMQKHNLMLMFAMLLVVLIFPVLKTIMPESATIKFINSKIDIAFVSLFFAIVAMFMGFGDEKKVMAKVPWNTLLLLGGVGMLINVATKAGLIDVLAGWVSGNIPAAVLPVMFAIVGGIMSFFSSTIGVVCPALFPIIPTVAEASGIAPVVLFVSLVLGAQASAISPFSAAGSMLVGACSDEKVYNKLFKEQITIAIPLQLALAVAAAFIMSIVM